MTLRTLPNSESTSRELCDEHVGLRAGPKGARVPLESVAFEAKVSGACARATLTQRYCNRERKPIEAVYVFPLEEGVAVCGFEAWIGDTRVVAQAMERDAAFEQYDDALAAGHGAYLLDEERPDVFVASVGNVPPGAEVKLCLTTVSELPFEGDAIRLSLPTTIAPRYAPAEDCVGVGPSAEEALNPPTQREVPYRLDVRIDVEMASAIRSIESPSHPIAVDADGRCARVTLALHDGALDRDFVLRVREQEPFRPQCSVEVDERGRHFACVSLLPQFEATEAPSEFVFVVDRSGSMMGSSIAEARNALQLCLRSLPEGSRFNIVGFGSSFELLFPESRPLDEASLAEATRHLASLDADLGGTEILSPLEAVLKAEPARGLPRQLFLLTDGEVTNSDAVLRLVRSFADTTRVFGFGIGYAPSHHLMRGIARAGGGQAEFIAPGERIERAVMRQLRRAVAPALTNVTVEWDGLEVSAAPHHAPVVFAGEALRIYAQLLGGNAGTLILRGKGPDGPVELRARVDATETREGSLVSRLWARTRIRDLEEGASELHERSGSKRGKWRQERIRAEIVRLGVEYRLASRETSFVAVEVRETPLQEEAELRRVPIALAKDWGGTRGMALDDACSQVSYLRMRSDTCSDVMMPTASPFAEDARMTPPAPNACLAPPRGLSPRSLDALVALQRADGSWELSDELAAALGRELRELEQALADALGSAADTWARRTFATALALAFLEREAADQRDEWLRLAHKAQRWLEKSAAPAPQAETWGALATCVLDPAGC